MKTYYRDEDHRFEYRSGATLDHPKETVVFQTSDPPELGQIFRVHDHRRVRLNADDIRVLVDHGATAYYERIESKPVITRDYICFAIHGFEVTGHLV